MVKSSSFLLACFLFLLLLMSPRHLFALSCGELREEVWLACQEGMCQAFSIEQKPKGGGCRVLPYFVELNSKTSQQIHQRLRLLVSDVENTGFWQVSLVGSCAYSMRREVATQERLDESLRIACGKSHQADLYPPERLTVMELNNEFDESMFRSRRDAEIVDAAAIRRSFYVFEGLRIAGSIFAGGVLPLSTVICYIQTKKPLFVKLILLFSIFQAGFAFFLLFFASVYASWAVLSLLVVVALFAVGLGLLIKDYFAVKEEAD